MERLTKRIFVPKEEQDVVVFTKGKYDDTIPAEMTYEDIRAVLRRLAEYEDFEEIFRGKMTDTACEFLKDIEEFGLWLDRNKWDAKKCDEYARAEEQGLLLRLPCKVGYTIYALCTCEAVGKVLDGTMYGKNGEPGTATGYYCPYDLSDKCPHTEADGCEECKNIETVFEDTIDCNPKQRRS